MKYIKPQMECVIFPVEDVISTSYQPSVPGASETNTLPTVDPDEGAIV